LCSLKAIAAIMCCILAVAAGFRPDFAFTGLRGIGHLARFLDDLPESPAAQVTEDDRRPVASEENVEEAIGNGPFSGRGPTVSRLLRDDLSAR
jgi:hypothetical protein